MASINDMISSSTALDSSDIVKGNTVDISNPTAGAANQLSTLQDQLGSSSLIPGGMTADNLIGDSLRCRIEELGGKIMDLIEDGFGLGSILDSLKEPDLSKLGDALKSLSPANLLKGLENISIEKIGAQIGKVIDGAIGYVVDIVKGTFDQVEKIMKGLGDSFDSIGDRVQDLGGLVEDTINGVVSGIGDVLSKIGDVPGMIAETIEKLLAPCAELPNDPNVISQVDFQKNKDLFNSNQDIVQGNVVAIGDIGHVTGQVSRITKAEAVKAATSNQAAAITSTPTGGITATADSGAVVPTSKINVPIAANKNDANGDDGKTESEDESNDRKDKEDKAAGNATASVTNTTVSNAANAKKAVDAKGSVNTDDSGEAADEEEKDAVFAPVSNCDTMLSVMNKLATISDHPQSSYTLRNELNQYIEAAIRGEGVPYPGLGSHAQRVLDTMDRIVYSPDDGSVYYQRLYYREMPVRKWEKVLIKVPGLTVEKFAELWKRLKDYKEKSEEWKSCMREDGKTAEIYKFNTQDGEIYSSTGREDKLARKLEKYLNDDFLHQLPRGYHPLAHYSMK